MPPILDVLLTALPFVLVLGVMVMLVRAAQRARERGRRRGLVVGCVTFLVGLVLLVVLLRMITVTFA